MRQECSSTSAMGGTVPSAVTGGLAAGGVGACGGGIGACGGGRGGGAGCLPEPVRGGGGGGAGVGRTARQTCVGDCWPLLALGSATVAAVAAAAAAAGAGFSALAEPSSSSGVVMHS
eukprot:6193699-Pleurochrysis_carterae.AAC.2